MYQCTNCEVTNTYSERTMDIEEEELSWYVAGVRVGVNSGDLGLQLKLSITFFRQKIRPNGHGSERTVKSLEGQDQPPLRCRGPE